jgi:hypothetical protein
MLYIYVLLLQNDKYYIGKTSNPHFRFDNYFINKGSEWIRLYKPIKVLELIPNCDDYDEDKYTYKYMDIYGIDNVRGGSYTSTILDKATKKQLIKISNRINNRCFNCNKCGHFTRECENNVILPLPASAKLISVSPNDFINLDTLLRYSPNIMLQNIKDLDIIKQLKNYKIKVGDYILNYNILEYSSLNDIIDDATKIYNYDEYDLMKVPGISNTYIAKEIKDKYLLPSKISLYKNIAELLDQISKDKCKLIQTGSIFTDIEYNIINNT